MDVGAALVADGQASVAGEPGEGTLHHPAVSSEAGAALDATACDARGDATGAALPAAATVVVGLIGVEFARPLPWAAAMADPDPRHGIQGGRQHHAIVPVGPAERQAKRRAAGVRDEVALRAWLAAIRRVRARLGAPLFAGTVALSSAARRQSICPAACNRSSSRRCKAAQTPAACQSRSRRQQLIPQPQPISAGSLSHGMPLTSTNTIPVNAARSASRGRPPLGLGRSGGNSGSIAAQRSSETKGFAMPTETHHTGFS